ncbi:MAG TPA: DUF58 domain-containing protein [Myxococcota bacterium]|nr:DUF58 domain-containing protein [Myxococcota bacterium]HND31000.1 DUF58 domain-containing protein [Myxococcota bacterium]
MSALPAPPGPLPLLRRAVGLFPLRPAGMLTGLGGLFIFVFYGLLRQDRLLLVFGAVWLLLWLLCLGAVLSGTILLGWGLPRAPGRALETESGERVRTGFSLHLPWFIPLLHLQWSWEYPAEVEVLPDVEGRHYTERVIARRRGSWSGIRRLITISDAFGLCAVTFPYEQQRELRFVPAKGRLDRVHVVQGLSGGDAIPQVEGSPVGDPLDLRAYAPGDPIRYVLWKVYGRSRELVVRTPERALAPIRRTVAYLVAGNGDEPAAGAARVAVQGALGQSWTFGADGSEGPASSAADAMERIIRSADVPLAEGARGLAAFFSTAGGDYRRAVLFVPPRPGPWLDGVKAAMGGSGLPPQLDFVICTDGFATPEKVPLLAPPPEPDPTRPLRTAPEDLRKVLTELGKCSSTILVVDRRTGELYHPHQLSKVLA